MREKAKQAAKSAALYALAAVRWLPAAALIGLLCGLVGAAFHHGIALASGFRAQHGWVIWLLPVGAVVIALLYRAMRLGPDAGTNLVLEAVRSEKQVPLLLAPAMFVATVLTQFVGGSAGREGAALQIGGSLAQGVAKLLRVKEENCHLLVLCGMAAVFSALFGTPVAAAVFVLEVASVGRFLYSALVPTLCASLTAGAVARALHSEVVRMALTVPGEAGVVFTLRTAVLAVACALLSIETGCSYYQSFFMFQAGLKHFHSEFDSRKITYDISLIYNRLYIIDNRRANGPSDHGNLADVLSDIVPACRTYTGYYLHIMRQSQFVSYPGQDLTYCLVALKELRQLLLPYGADIHPLARTTDYCRYAQSVHPPRYGNHAVGYHPSRR